MKTMIEKMANPKFAIKQKIKERKVFLDKHEKSWSKKLLKYTMEEPKEVDIIGAEIRGLVKKYVDMLPVDFSIESLTMLGDAPCVIYDDNGMFAVTGDGYQKVVVGNERLDGPFTVSVEKKMWKKTILAALKFYMK